MSKFLTPPVWYDSEGNLVEILTGSISSYGGTVPTTDSMAIGKNASAGGEYSVAVGTSTFTYDSNTVAIGYNAISHGDGNIVIGSRAQSYDDSNPSSGNIVIGKNSTVYGNDSIAIGNGIELGTDKESLNHTIQIGRPTLPYTFKVGNIDVFDAINIAAKTFYINASRYTATWDPASGTLNFITM